VRTIRERLRAVRYRLFGRCWAKGCGRLMLLHTPRQLERCLDTPLALVLTDKGRRRLGLQPDSVVPVSHALCA